MKGQLDDYTKVSLPTTELGVQKDRNHQNNVVGLHTFAERSRTTRSNRRTRDGYIYLANIINDRELDPGARGESACESLQGARRVHGRGVHSRGGEEARGLLRGRGDASEQLCLLGLLPREVSVQTKAVRQELQGAVLFRVGKVAGSLGLRGAKKHGYLGGVAGR